MSGRNDIEGGASDLKHADPTVANGAAQEQENKKANTPYLMDGLKLVPQIGWLILAGLLIYFLVGPTARTLERNAISKVGMAGFTIEFVQRQIEQAAQAKSQGIPAALKDRIDRTATNMFDVSVMWLDDEPVVNAPVRRALNSLGITVDLARSTEEAIELIVDGKYAVLITDQNRKKEKNAAVCFAGTARGQPLDDQGAPVANAGCYFVRQAKKLFDAKNEPMPPTIIYTSKDYPDWGIPTYAFGITTQVDQLFHLILDALERQQRAGIGMLPPH